MLTAACIWAVCPAAAQEASPLLEEIVVTATKREALLGDVPLSVAAIDGRRLLETNIQSKEIGVEPRLPETSVRPLFRWR